MVIDEYPTHDNESAPFDISERLKNIIEVDNLGVETGVSEIMSLRKDLMDKMNIKINLDFSLRLLASAPLIKKLFELKPFGAEWKFVVRASKSQGEELKKIFGGLVEVAGV